MALSNPIVDKELAKFAHTIFADIKGAKDNESILESLNLLGEFIYKVPKEVIKILDYIFQKRPILVVLHKSPFGEFNGKSHKDLVLKSIELLSQLRYIAHSDVLRLLVLLSQDSDLEVKQKALEVVKKFSRYDFNVLTESKIGYGAQRAILDLILSWPPNEQLKRIDFLETVLRELLDCSVEGTTSGLNDEAQYTITLHSGVISPTDFLKKIRREAINLVFKIYQSVSDEERKVRLVKILETATRTPGNVLYGDDVRDMIRDDVQYLTGIYRRMLFDADEKLVGSIAVAEEIQERLYWMQRNKQFDIEELKKLRSDILNDGFYALFRLFAGDDIVFREEVGWDNSDGKREKMIDAKVEEVNSKNIVQWKADLEKISQTLGPVEEWHFLNFKRFLRKLASQKPEIADEILENAFGIKMKLKTFSASFLEGFRDAERIDVWEKYVGLIAQEQDPSLVSAICFSLNLDKGIDVRTKSRKEDLDILEQIVKKTSKFSFLKEDNGKNHLLHYSLINTLARNFLSDPRRIENLLIQEIHLNPQYVKTFWNQLPFLTMQGWIDVAQLSKKGVQFFIEQMVVAPDLDWHLQQLLLEIGRDDFELIMNVFLNRIRKGVEKKENNPKRVLGEEHYDPIPYHFNPDLQKYIVSHQAFLIEIQKWVAEVDTEWSTYNWEVSNFLERIGAPLQEILKPLIEKGDDKSLLKAVRTLDTFHGGKLDIYLEIIARTDNKRVIDKIDGLMYSTGVVSGEYGIANAYEARAKELEKYKDEKNPRIQKFTRRMITSFRDSAEKERQHRDEEKQLRKIEFDS